MMKTVQSQVKSGFVAFIKFAPGVFLLGIFLGVVMATVSAGWPRYLVSFFVFTLALLFYIDYERKQREKMLSKKYAWKKEQDE